MLITAITCTSDRHEAFVLAERYMSRQTRQPDQWLVLDDGEKPVTPTLGQQYIYCPECRGKKSMVNKVRLALTSGLVKGDALVFIEDDDAYRENWIAWCAEKLTTLDLVGEGWAIYYNVRQRTWFSHQNNLHASLCSTAVGKRFFPLVIEVCNGILRSTNNDAFIDDPLWKMVPDRKQVFCPSGIASQRMVVGIKAMPGKVGYGPAHVRRDTAAKDDPNLAKLREFIGTDADNYAPFYQMPPPPPPAPVPPPPPPVVNIAKSECGRAHGPNWLKWAGKFKGQPGIVGMEFGTWKGESAEWFLDNIFTDPSSTYYCIDPFTGSEEHALAHIDCSSLEAQTRERLKRFANAQIIKDGSENALKHFIGKVSVAYIDGDHHAFAALRDACTAFTMLAVGGVMVFDDYEWMAMPRPTDRPRMAIDAFLACYADKVRVLGRGWQVAVEKISE